MSGTARRIPDKQLVKPGGPPDPPDMEARLGRLEPVLSRIDVTQQKHGQDLLKIMVDVAELKSRVFQLPNTVQLLGFVLAVLAITGVLHVFVR